ncbi:restriction endonuclease subunit S [Parabacteroides distasonis]|uniref:Restriction endonuclease subunit S n=2 Tax=Bacteroidales TaxID=171549 RepID=A0A7K0GMX6_PARDI|nr:restriction endonuclease subunit S [Parabacteroides distasonis]MRY60519.1 restriction endonuclease subunit S [Parabacteroides distasonis]
MMSKKSPQLRFEGFTDDWEERKLKDVSTYIRGSFPQPYTNPDFYDEKNGKPFVQVADIGYDLKLKPDTKSHISKLAESKSRFVEAGKVVVALQGSIETSIGRTAITQYDAFFDRTILIFQEYKVPIDKQYFSQIIKKLFEREKERAWGATISTITKEHLNDFIVGVPSIEEQQKIGTFFKQLDDTIALHQRKLDLLKEQKKGYLQKMFPKNGAKVPELRFAGFADDWEERKLGEISKMYQPLTITGNDLLPDGVPVFGANGFIGFFSEANHIDDQVTISARGEGTGTPSYVHGPVWITGNSMVVNVGDFDIDKYFLFANLTANSLKKYVTGGAQPQLTRDVLVKVPITLPNTDEQKKIGAFFKQFDDTITLHQRKLDLLKEQKKGFLQKMFV